MSENSVLVKGAHANRIHVRKGQLLEVINVDGNQVCDFFAFNLDNIRETLSPGHMRSVVRKIYFEVGTSFGPCYGNRCSRW